MKPLKISFKKKNPIKDSNYFTIVPNSQENNFVSFIEHEEINFNNFFNNIEIKNYKFDENEYFIFKKIWANKKLIDDIYKIIDELIKRFKLKKELRFLIIGDLFFSIIPTNLYDHSQFMFIIERSSFLEKIKLRANINFYSKDDRELYIILFMKILIGLNAENIIKKFIKRKKFKKNWHTLIFFKIDFFINFKTDELLIGFSEQEFLMISINNKKYCFNSFRNMWLMKRKKAEMKDVNICYKSVIKASQIPFFLCEKLYILNKELIENWKNFIFEKIKCSNFDDFYLKFREMFNNNISFLLLNNNENENFNNNVIFKYFQKIISLSILNKNIFNKTIYLPCYMDNRGRQYFGTSISPTFNVLFRNLYKFKTEKDFVKLKDSKFYKRIMYYKNQVKKFNLDDENSYILLVLLIEVGKFFINIEKGYTIKNEEIINLGINNFNTNNLNIKFEDSLYLQKIYFMIDQLINNKKIDINTIIFKDATASGLQNFGILLGYKKNKLHLLNIDNKHFYCDTYKYLIDTFLEINDDTLKKRKYWKKMIMTIPYNATLFSCFNTLIKELKKDEKDYLKMDPQKQKELKELHKNFYNSIKKNIKSEFFENKKVNKRLKKFIYYIIEKKILKEFKIAFRNKRDKYVMTIDKKEIDEKTTMKASEANNMHYLDSLLVKYLLMKFEILTIHDEFGIRLCELHLLMDEINNYYSNIIGEDTYSIHVII